MNCRTGGGHGDPRQAAVLAIGAARRHAPRLQAIDYAGDGAVAERDLPAELLQAHAVGKEKRLHHHALRCCKLAACILGSVRSPQNLPDLVQIELDRVRQ
jgi:hypothetical protein